MLVSKTKPCMSQYRPKIRRNREWLIKSVAIHWMLTTITWITVVILELIHATELRPRFARGKGAFIRLKRKTDRASVRS